MWINILDETNPTHPCNHATICWMSQWSTLKKMTFHLFIYFNLSVLFYHVTHGMSPTSLHVFHLSLVSTTMPIFPHLFSHLFCHKFVLRNIFDMQPLLFENLVGNVSYFCRLPPTPPLWAPLYIDNTTFMSKSLFPFGIVAWFHLINLSTINFSNTIMNKTWTGDKTWIHQNNTFI